MERAARRLRLDAIDFAAHAKAAGLQRCGLEKTGVAAADAALAPAFAERIAKAHATFLLAERAVARRYDPAGAVRERASYWVALFEVLDKVGGDIDGEVPTTAEGDMYDYFDAYRATKDAADYLSSIAQGQEPITSEKIGESEGRRRVKAFGEAGVTLLERSGPAGQAALRILRRATGGQATAGEPS